MRPKGDLIWMIGDNPINDIKGSRASIDAVTIQKLHSGVERGINEAEPDATFEDFKEIRNMIAKLK